jgi:hypothetical protein
MSADRVSVTRKRVDSGVVVALGLIVFAMILLAFQQIVGWNATWRAFGVTPLQPTFFDMHVINDYAACAAKGVDAYTPHSCNEANFNIPPTWLWLGSLGIGGTDSAWMSVLMIGAAAIVMVMLFRGGPWLNGVVALAALVSPSVMMGVERGNLDLLILTLVGASALIYDERKLGPSLAAVGLLSLGIALKLLPMFCVSLLARFSKRTFIVACVISAVGCAFLILTFQYLVLIRRNVPTTFVLSYGYKAIFLGIDHMRDEAGLSPWHLADTWLPFLTTAFVLVCAVTVAVRNVFNERKFFSIDQSIAGTAFLFGAGIYCGTYLLGTNFIYRLMFLLLCIPQLLDWLVRTFQTANWVSQAGLLTTVLGVLWLNGNSNGETTFLLLPQVLNWLLFFLLAAILTLNLLHRRPGYRLFHLVLTTR